LNFIPDAGEAVKLQRRFHANIHASMQCTPKAWPPWYAWISLPPVLSFEKPLFVGELSILFILVFNK
jgi:hypothetical protein